jgi:hypothetical protein
MDTLRLSIFFVYGGLERWITILYPSFWCDCDSKTMDTQQLFMVSKFSVAIVLLYRFATALQNRGPENESVPKPLDTSLLWGYNSFS